MNRRRALGRGLEALIPSADLEDPDRRHGASLRVPITQIRPNPEQPRRVFAPETLAELADSIRLHGVLQPLLVRELAQGYELIAGERRLRAAEMAGLADVPVMVHSGIGWGSADKLELSLIENLQRADLNPIEEARALRRLTEEFGLTQQAVAERLAKDRTMVAHGIRLLGLPESVQAAIASGTITAGHGRTLLGLPSVAQQEAAVSKIVQEGWNVRQTEDWVRLRRADGTPLTPRRARPVDPDTLALEEEFRRALGTKVVLSRVGQGGRLTIEFYSSADLEALRQRLIPA